MTNLWWNIDDLLINLNKIAYITVQDTDVILQFNCNQKITFNCGTLERVEQVIKPLKDKLGFKND